ncbi:MAG: hypothetical protein ACFE96_16325, partial [Candidatus Hermodarchaeota archaeon]
MKNEQMEIDLKDIESLESIFNLFLTFINKFPVRKPKFNINRFRKKIEDLKLRHHQNEKIEYKEYLSLLEKIKSTIQKVVLPEILYIVGWHGGIIINDIGFCEFDDPSYAMDRLIENMRLSIENQMPFNLEVAINCLKWLYQKYSERFEEFLDLFKKGKSEIINPSYSQPYNLIIGPESNLKHFEFGLKYLKDIELESNAYYYSESSIHPQIPQILKGFGIKYASLRTRLLGVNPTANSPHINWIGLDNTVIDAIIDQSGIFNGEYWHGTFFQEIPSLLFQAVARPYMKSIVYSSLEDFINKMPYQEAVWSVSENTDVFGKFFGLTEFFELTEKDGDFKYVRDEFRLSDNVFQSSKLFLYNKNSEISIGISEILNTILSFFNEDARDTFFDLLWEKLLPIQAHDCYVVPHIKSGDYLQIQLDIEDLRKTVLTKSPNSISKLSIQMHREIQTICKDQIKYMLLELAKEIFTNQVKLDENPNTIFVFNPTPYLRRDVVHQKKFHCGFIAEIPGFGYKVYSLSEILNKKYDPELEFLYNINLSEDFKKIIVKYKDKLVYELSFLRSIPYELELIKKNTSDVEERYIFDGNANNKSLKVEIIQFKGINRLEVILETASENHVVLTPKVNILKSLINYPFGVEETRRNQIQTLDFVWLKSNSQQIIYIQKNSQRFEINHSNFELKNILFDKGRYEFAIVITDKGDNLTILKDVYSYYYRLLSIGINIEKENYEEENSFLSIKPPLPIISLWKRNSGLYLR